MSRLVVLKTVEAFTKHLEDHETRHLTGLPGFPRSGRKSKPRERFSEQEHFDRLMALLHVAETVHGSVPKKRTGYPSWLFSSLNRLFERAGKVEIMTVIDAYRHFYGNHPRKRTGNQAIENPVATVPTSGKKELRGFSGAHEIMARFVRRAVDLDDAELLREQFWKKNADKKPIYDKVKSHEIDGIGFAGKRTFIAYLRHFHKCPENLLRKIE